MTGFSAVFWLVQAVFLVILGLEAAEGAPFSSYIVLGTGIRFDLRGIMLEDRRHSGVPAVQQNKKKPIPPRNFGANRAQFCPRVEYKGFFLLLLLSSSIGRCAMIHTDGRGRA
jgi:hypothetical protein